MKEKENKMCLKKGFSFQVPKNQLIKLLQMMGLTTAQTSSNKL